MIGSAHAGFPVEMFTAVNGHSMCMECKICRRARAGSHPDLEVYRDGTMEEARAIATLLTRRPVEATRLVMIDGYRSTAYQNAMLKTLEAPGRSTVIVWVVPSEDGILATVRSRANRYFVGESLSSVPSTVAAAAAAWLVLVHTRDLLSLSTVAESWDDPRAVLGSIVYEVIRTAPQLLDDHLDTVLDIYEAAKSAPALNLLNLLASTLVEAGV